MSSFTQPTHNSYEDDDAASTSSADERTAWRFLPHGRNSVFEFILQTWPDADMGRSDVEFLALGGSHVVFLLTVATRPDRRDVPDQELVLRVPHLRQGWTCRAIVAESVNIHRFVAANDAPEVTADPQAQRLLQRRPQAAFRAPRVHSGEAPLRSHKDH
jgi:hypothetical protein